MATYELPHDDATTNLIKLNAQLVKDKTNFSIECKNELLERVSEDRIEEQALDTCFGQFEAGLLTQDSSEYDNC
jgi:hypothetical protein